MSIHAAPRRPARGARSWLAVALLLVPALSRASEPVMHVPRGEKSAERPRIGRIFSAPNSRPGARTDGSQASPAALPAPGAARQRTYVNGTLSIGSRPRAVWINGVPVDAASVRQGTHSVRPGQSIGRDGGIEDLLPPGSLTRR
jgi:hypothetical protein